MGLGVGGRESEKPRERPFLMEYTLHAPGSPGYRLYVAPDKSTWSESELENLAAKVENAKAARSRGEGHLVCVCSAGFACLLHREKPRWETVKPLPVLEAPKAAWDGQLALALTLQPSRR